MSKTTVTATVRKIDSGVSVIEVKGELNAFAENALMDAYTQASAGGAKTILLDFSGLEYMSSSGIGLLVTLLIRCNRQKQRIIVCNLTEHYQRIFELTRLNEAITIFPTEVEALKSFETTMGEFNVIDS